MFCIYCGKEVVSHAIYCNHCGKYIGETEEFKPDDNDNNVVFAYGSFPWQDDKDSDDGEIDFGQEVRVYGTVNKTRFSLGPWGKNKKK